MGVSLTSFKKGLICELHLKEIHPELQRGESLLVSFFVMGYSWFGSSRNDQYGILINMVICSIPEELISQACFMLNL